jgi:hypothetical protein
LDDRWWRAVADSNADSNRYSDSYANAKCNSNTYSDADRYTDAAPAATPDPAALTRRGVFIHSGSVGLGRQSKGIEDRNEYSTKIAKNRLSPWARGEDQGEGLPLARDNCCESPHPPTLRVEGEAIRYAWSFDHTI